MEIKGKIGLVLGAARGIGKAIGFALAEAGARVVLTHWDWPEDAARMQRELAALDGDHLAVRVDLREPDQVRDLIGRISQHYGSLHILVNNIERGGMPVVHGSYDLNHNREQWELELTTTLQAKWLAFHHSLPLLQASGEGTVVNISSIAGLVGRTGPAGLLFSDGYSAANRAISTLTETWAREGGPTIRVNELMLGLVETRHGAGTRGWEALSDMQRQTLLDHTLLRRVGNIEDVVKTVMFLVRDADFMTGSVVRLDGGYLLGGEQVPVMPAGILGDEN